MTSTATQVNEERGIFWRKEIQGSSVTMLKRRHKSRLEKSRAGGGILYGPRGSYTKRGGTMTHLRKKV